jgi:hypothetical protein
VEARPQINNHHIWWPRRKYNSAIETRLRQHAGFLIGMLAVDHTSLHKAIEPPEHPTAELMADILNQAGPKDFKPEEPTETLRRTVNYLYRNVDSNWSDDYSHQSERIANNLTKQLGFIMLNPIRKNNV